MRTYTLTRKQSRRPRKGEPLEGLRRISYGSHDLELVGDQHIYRGVCENVAIIAEQSGEFEIKLEGD